MGKLIIANNYGVTPNEILNHKELSLKAKGLFGYLQSKPNEWKFSTERIALHLKEGEKAIRSTLQELEEFGLLKRERLPKGQDGKWQGHDYILSETINRTPKPSSPKGVVPKKGSTDKGNDISNKDYSNKDIVINKDIAEVNSAIIPDLLKDKNIHIQIIGLYALAKKIEFKSIEQQKSFIKRNLRPAKDLISYDIERVKEVLRYLYQYADFKWTLETVGKYIDEDLNKLKINNHNIAII
jgi:hypothetical protein